MRAVLTRVNHASVTIDGQVHSSIGKGFLILLGVHRNDTEKEADKIADKICGLRIFEDEAGKMNNKIHPLRLKLAFHSSHLECGFSSNCSGLKDSSTNAFSAIFIPPIYY